MYFGIDSVTCRSLRLMAISMPKYLEPAQFIFTCYNAVRVWMKWSMSLRLVYERLKLKELNYALWDELSLDPDVLRVRQVRAQVEIR